MKVFRDKKQPSTLLFINELTMEYAWGVGGYWVPCGDWGKMVLLGHSNRMKRIDLKYYYDRFA